MSKASIAILLGLAIGTMAGENEIKSVTTNTVVTVTTNEVRSVVAVKPAPCPDGYKFLPGMLGRISCAVLHYENVYGDVIEKKIVTQTNEVQTLRLVWDGQEHAIEHVRSLGCGQKTLVEKREWVEE